MSEPTGRDDAAIETTDEANAEASGSSALFDIRKIIGGLFIVYGVLLIVAGFAASSATKAKSNGININLWTGLGMLVVGILFTIWGFTTPAHATDDDHGAGADDEPRTPEGRLAG